MRFLSHGSYQPSGIARIHSHMNTITQHNDCPYRSEYFFIYCDVVLQRHSGMFDDLTAESINYHHMGNPIHHQILSLVQMTLVAKILRMIRNLILIPHSETVKQTTTF